MMDTGQEVRNQEWALRKQIREYRKTDDRSHTLSEAYALNKGSHWENDKY